MDAVAVIPPGDDDSKDEIVAVKVERDGQIKEVLEERARRTWWLDLGPEIREGTTCCWCWSSRQRSRGTWEQSRQCSLRSVWDFSCCG